MKKILAYAASLAMAMSVNLALPTAAHAAKGGASATVELCKALVEGTDISVGSCVVALNNDPEKGFCKVLFDIGAIDSVGQCIKENG